MSGKPNALRTVRKPRLPRDENRRDFHRKARSKKQQTVSKPSGGLPKSFNSLEARCDLCGIADLSINCGEPSCLGRTHPWCSSLLSIYSVSRCISHIYAKENSRVVPLRSAVARLIRGETAFPAVLRDCIGVSEPAYGSIFWDFIGQVHFPVFKDAETVRKCLDFPSGISQDIAYRSTKGKKSFIDQEIEHVEEEILALKEFLDPVETVLTDLCIGEIQMKAEYAQYLPIEKPNIKDWFLMENVTISEHQVLYDQYCSYIQSKYSLPFKQSPHSSRGILCMVCQASEHTDDDFLVVCSVIPTQSCEECVHQQCYGLLKVPEGDWFCEACLAFGAQEAKNVNCVLCPVLGAGIKQTVNRNDGSLSWVTQSPYDPSQPHSVLNPKNLWCHIYCALGVKGVYIGKKRLRTDIDVSQAEGFSSLCNICGSDVGACIPCAKKKCKATFHVECTKRLFVAYTEKDRDVHSLYCQKHSPTNLTQIRIKRNETQIKTMEVFWTAWDKQEQVLPIQGRALSFPPWGSQLTIYINLRRVCPRDQRVQIHPRLTATPLFTFLESTTATLYDKESCPCGKPYLSLLPQRGLSDADFEQALKDYSLVSCDKCGQWFHYKCVGFRCDQVDQPWCCPRCRS